MKWFGFRDTTESNSPRLGPDTKVVGTQHPWYGKQGVTVSEPIDWMGTWVIEVRWENGGTEKVAIDSLTQRH